MQFVLLQAAIGLLCVSVLLLLLLWIYRFVQYRHAVQLSHARWLHYEPGQVFADDDQSAGIPWPSAKPIMLSPIPEERIESGPVYETCGCGADQRRLLTFAFHAGICRLGVVQGTPQQPHDHTPLLYARCSSAALASHSRALSPDGSFDQRTN